MGLVSFRRKIPLIKGHIHFNPMSMFVTYSISGMIPGILHSYSHPVLQIQCVGDKENQIRLPKVTQLVKSRV